VEVKTALTIGGSDPSGAGGIQGDIKVFGAYNVYGMAAVTAVTSQNSQGVKDVAALSAGLLEKQIRAVHEDIRIGSTKIGMIYSMENLEMISKLVSELNLRNTVLDPVFSSSSGMPLLDTHSISKMVDILFPLVDIVTPNLDEAAVITGKKISNKKDMKEAASAIKAMGPKFVLIKGGHLDESATDILYDGNYFEIFESQKIVGKGFRGTGCALSAGIAAGLAKGSGISDSVRRAKDYVTSCIRRGYQNLGKGMGILNHSAVNPWRVHSRDLQGGD